METKQPKQPQTPKRATIAPERRSRFRWEAGDLKFISKAEFEQMISDPNSNVTLYSSSASKFDSK